ncbi:ABC multidrug transporter [Ectocarpus siliculosus]|uniref:ABC multidrug transporter n=1 Tax=Ectocarpus siliculosus TaxID=2880 RepID=D7FSP7_ECTSI|nr:ABC multidrug transporter [Ectocarpus siliculosus]|eukprot:CBJ31188.1 ABC multidrug transporter [Ectocarpus siliculosus]
MSYRRDLTPSLMGVNLTVGAGEKVGIVGRTGSGKTSLLRAIFGLYPYSGCIDIDGVDISTLPVHLLRSRLAVIPQDPLLFAGTVRENLDPSGEHPDTALWQALRSSRLADVDLDRDSGGGSDGAIGAGWGDPSTTKADSTVGSGGAVARGSVGGFRLDTELDGYGANMSSGQRQLLCIARALLRRSKIVCVDEATARMDVRTAKLVDAAMAEAFRDATVLTVAHRLPPVLESCDKVAVMSEGRVVEQGKPRDLAADTTSRFIV